jgi:hypothetical protein
MERNRFWIEIIGLCSAIAFGVALLIATLGAALSLTAEPAVGQETGSPAAQSKEQAPASQVYEGMVTCSRCGAKHSAGLEQSASNCARRCVASGATFALVVGEKIYLLEGDATMLKQVAGQRARVVGVARGNTIKVSSLNAA